MRNSQSPLRLHTIAAAVVLATLTAGLAACGGGSNGASLPASPTSAGKSGATFMIHVPHASSQGTQTQSASRKPAFISPATQSITVVITPQSGGAPVFNETVGLTPTSQGCTSTLASTLCELQVALNPGSYDATLTTFDGVNGSGNTLSTAQNIPFTIVAGQNNQVNLTLSGIPAQIITKYQEPNTFYVAAVDADKNFIVGSGAPSFAVSQTSGSLALTLTQPTSNAPNVFTAVPTSTDASATLNVTASYPTGTNACAQPAAVCTATLGLTASDQLFVTTDNNTVSEYAPPYTDSPVTTISNGVSTPQSLAFDARGDLFVANAFINTVTEYASPYTGSPTATISNGVDQPEGLAVDGSGNLFVSDNANNAVTEYASPYTGSPVATISNSLSGPDGLALDGSGNLFVVDTSSSTVTEYASPYTGSPTATISNSLKTPVDLAFSVGGNLFVSNVNTNAVTEYTSPYTGSPTATITNSLSEPDGVAFDANGNLFIANPGNNTITEYAPPYTGSPTATILTSDPLGVALFNTLTVSP